MSGLAGRLFAPLDLAYISAILASLIVARTVTPALCLALLERRDLPQEDAPLARWLKKRYDDLVYINFSRLRDGERNSTGDRRWWNRQLLHPLVNLGFAPGFVMEFVRFVWTNPVDPAYGEAPYRNCVARWLNHGKVVPGPPPRELPLHQFR